MRRLRVGLLAACFIGSTVTAAQAASGRPRNAVYGEFLGSALLGSVNYDRLLTDHLSVRVGIGYLNVFDQDIYTFPVMLKHITGQGDHHFEIGGGPVMLSLPTNIRISVRDDEQDMSFLMGTSFAYRYQPVKKGFFLRVGATPFVAFAGTLHALPWGGLSLGATF
jgi:hypothetical protein